MQNYELLAIFPGTLSETEVQPSVDKVRQVITENGGENLQLNDMGKSRLSYPIRHIRYGYFQVGRFQAEAEAVNKIQQKLKMMPELLRALITKYNPETHKEGKIIFAHVIAEKTPTEERSFDAVAANVRSVKVEVTKEPEVATEKVTEEIEITPEPTVEVKTEAEKTEAEKAAPAKKTTRGRKSKVSLDDIDKKLDEILDIDLEKV
jgi:small subunit ribosomal protein S6